MAGLFVELGYDALVKNDQIDYSFLIDRLER